MNLFDITRSIEAPLGSSPRKANDCEIAAYMQWKRERLGLPDMGETNLHYCESRNGRKYERGHCIGATYGKQPERGTWENGAYSIVMPGHDVNRARVTMETLDDAGEVVTSQTLPAEPKKGGVIWTRDDVRKAAGPIAKPAKGKAAPKCAEIDSQSEAGEAIAPCVALDSGEAVEALCEAPSSPIELSDIAGQLPADPIAELTARLDALEARLNALPMESAAGATETVTPTVAKRTPAHERAIRRAWAERKARRDAEKHNRIGMGQLDAMRAELREAERCRDALRADCHEWEALQHRTWTESMGHKVKRRAATIRARRMIASARKAETFQRQRADVLHAQLVKLQADMADPMQPERASDLAQLIRERDEARVASAASQARAQRSEAATLACAEQIEQLASRVARAEALLRNAA